MLKEIIFTFLLSASPVLELRGGIPLGVLFYKLHPFLVYFVAVFGNFLIVPFILIFLKYFSEFLMHRFYYFNQFLNYIFARTRNHHAHKFEKYEHFALFLLVAIPLPLTGAWTGALAAFLFGIPFKRSLALIFAGIAVAGMIVTVATMFGVNFLT